MINTRGCQNYSKFRCSEEWTRDLVLNSEVQERLIGASRKFCPLLTRELKENGSWAALPCPPLHTLPSALPALSDHPGPHTGRRHKDESPSHNADNPGCWVMSSSCYTDPECLSPGFFLWNNVFIDSHYYVFKGVFFFFFFLSAKKAFLPSLKYPNVFMPPSE